MPTINHSLSSIITALNEKIAALQAAKDKVEKQVIRGHHVPQNTKTLEDICESLEAAENARKLMMDSCCTSQSCNFDYSE